MLDAIGVSKKVSTKVIGPVPESASQLPGAGWAPAAFAPERATVGIALGGEGKAFCTAEREQSLAGDARAGVRVGVERAHQREGGPLADGDGADAFIGLQRVPDAGAAPDDGDAKHDEGEEGGFQHGSPVGTSRFG